MAKQLTDDDLKLYYSIGEAAQLLEVPASKIRFWDKEFPHLKPTKNSRGERRFTKDNIRQLQQINYLLKERGFTIEGARKEIASGKKQPEYKQAIIDALLQAKARLESLL